MFLCDERVDHWLTALFKYQLKSKGMLYWPLLMGAAENLTETWNHKKNHQWKYNNNSLFLSPIYLRRQLIINWLEESSRAEIFLSIGLDIRFLCSSSGGYPLFFCGYKNFGRSICLFLVIEKVFFSKCPPPPSLPSHVSPMHVCQFISSTPPPLLLFIHFLSNVSVMYVRLFR